MTIFNQFRNKIFPTVAGVISSPQLRFCRRTARELVRGVTGQPHRVEAYLSLTDPYSYILSQLLPQLQQYYGVQLVVYVVRDLPGDMFPEPEMWQQNALRDARYLAEILELEYPSALESKGGEELELKYLSQLVAVSGELTDIDECAKVFRNAWLGNGEALAEQQRVPPQDVQSQLDSHQRRLVKKGHYQSAMLWYGGEWYWGVDRLWHLESRLQTLGLAGHQQLLWHSFYQARNVNTGPVPQRESREPRELILYLSIRSPYSYLALEQAVEFCRDHHLILTLKPVLPMVMRGLPVPKAKKMYIFHDTKREAMRLGIPYGRVADPLGQAVKNCYALFDLAKGVGNEQNLLCEFARAVNSEGIDGATSEGLKIIVQRAGLDWESSQAALATEHWQDWAEEHRLEILNKGQWGVPCFCFGDITVWGQDRLWVIKRALESEDAS